jgi:hypothetical protein
MSVWEFLERDAAAGRIFNNAMSERVAAIPRTVAATSAFERLAQATGDRAKRQSECQG